MSAELVLIIFILDLLIELLLGVIVTSCLNFKIWVILFVPIFVLNIDREKSDYS